MKYLKYYESNRFRDIELYLNDIFQELIDEGFIVKINTSANFVIVNLQMGSAHEQFKYDKIKDYVDSSIDYLETIVFIRHVFTYDRSLIGRKIEFDPNIPPSGDLIFVTLEFCTTEVFPLMRRKY